MANVNIMLKCGFIFPNLFLYIFCGLTVLQVAVSGPSFTVDTQNRTFVKDGKPFNYISGSIHYSRVPFYYWQDRLEKMYAAGLDAIQVYVPWNVHEPVSGVYDFKGQQDLEAFIKLAHKIGLLVLLRAGPYICGEWEYGGLPAWLLENNPNVLVRTMDQDFIKPVDKWFSILLPKMKPLLYSNGGPIIMVQVENEYGSYYACDKDYMTHLVQTFRKHLGNDILLYSTDGSGLGFLKCGAHPDLLTTVDFGPGNITAGFEPLQQWNSSTPLVNSEYYTGWLDYWGGSHAHGSTDAIVAGLKQVLDMKASLSMYMFEGGTNFGFTNGADPPFKVCPTSYDYDAPLSEAGDPTDKYMAIRQLMSQYKKVPQTVPPATPKYAYGKVALKKFGTVTDLLAVVSPAEPITVPYPLTMEKIRWYHGFVLYRHVLEVAMSGKNLEVPGIRDMGYVLVNGWPRGLLDRQGVTGINLVARAGDTLDIIVENQGRINFGKDILNNTKGIISNVTVDGMVLKNWIIYPLNFSKIFEIKTAFQMNDLYNVGKLNVERMERKYKDDFKDTSEMEALQPTVYTGTFTCPMSEPLDTFLNMTGWFKGQAYINGFNVGRYWPVRGPQVTLFVPKGVIKPSPAMNTVVMVELQRSPCWSDCSIHLSDTPVINATAAPWGGEAHNYQSKFHYI